MPSLCPPPLPSPSGAHSSSNMPCLKTPTGAAHALLPPLNTAAVTQACQPASQHACAGETSPAINGSTVAPLLVLGHVPHAGAQRNQRRRYQPVRLGQTLAQPAERRQGRSDAVELEDILSRPEQDNINRSTCFRLDTQHRAKGTGRWLLERERSPCGCGKHEPL